MHWRLLVSLLPHLLVCHSLAGPVIHEAFEDDVAAVGSLIREVRQPAPLRVATEVEDLTGASNAQRESRDTEKRAKNASGKSDEGGYYRTYGSDAEGEKGYLKETYGKGDQGYKTLDTFHKQDGDKYEFETQTSYGKAGDKTRNEKKNRDHESAGTMVDTDYVGGEGDHGEASEYSHYGGGEEGDHYSGQHTEEEPESTSYGHKENYSSGGDDEGSYETHSSYSSDGDGEDEGEHY